jgi:hypothetical protein
LGKWQQNLNQLMPEQMINGTTIDLRTALFCFIGQLSALQAVTVETINDLLRHYNRDPGRQMLIRGLYFTSAIQQNRRSDFFQDAIAERYGLRTTTQGVWQQKTTRAGIFCTIFFRTLFSLSLILLVRTVVTLTPPSVNTCNGHCWWGCIIAAQWLVLLLSQELSRRWWPLKKSKPFRKSARLMPVSPSVPTGYRMDIIRDATCLMAITTRKTRCFQIWGYIRETELDNWLKRPISVF